ncbi:putative uncharacterized protein DDB_G0293878 [Nilaparvata lugens]|uniref:putative uncharacterized protein DDB_G0293878 n=1 Tax=Nilaparvata lugens TaxID=108931 RepID=UPI00193E762B|nr:putative uncharacterized protein DDB_G0293878 [Nilaparvata lugens]
MLLVMYLTCFLTINRLLIQASSIITKDMIVSAGGRGFRFGRHMTEYHNNNISNNTSKTSEQLPEKNSLRNSPVKIFQPVFVHSNDTRDQLPDYLLRSYEPSSKKSIRNRKAEFITRLRPVKNDSNGFEKYTNSSEELDGNPRGVGKSYSTSLRDSVNNSQSNDSSSSVKNNSSCSRIKCENISDVSNDYKSNNAIKKDTVNDFELNSNLDTLSQLSKNHPLIGVDLKPIENNNFESLQERLMNMNVPNLHNLQNENSNIIELLYNFISYLNRIESFKMTDEGVFSFHDQKIGCAHNDEKFHSSSVVKGPCGAQQGSNIDTVQPTGDSRSRRIVGRKPLLQQATANELLLKLKLLLMLPATALTSLLALALLTSGSALSLSSLALSLLLSLAAGHREITQRPHATSRVQPEPEQYAFYMR